MVVAVKLVIPDVSVKLPTENNAIKTYACYRLWFLLPTRTFVVKKDGKKNVIKTQHV
jgi:hypothetical protein